MKFIKSIEELRPEGSVKKTCVDQYGAFCEEEKACAKFAEISGTEKYFVLQSSAQRRVFNPIIDDYHKKLPGRTEKEFQLTEASKEAFEVYCEYLRTKNPLMLKRAEMAIKR